MLYKELLEEAKKAYYEVAKQSPFAAQFKARKIIASKIDQCSDRNEHLDVLEWDEYKNNYAPISKETYERRKQAAKERYDYAIAEIEKEYEERGKFSPDYHKI